MRGYFTYHCFPTAVHISKEGCARRKAFNKVSTASKGISSTSQRLGCVLKSAVETQSSCTGPCTS